MPTRTPRIPDAALAKIPGKARYRMATAGADVVIGGGHPTLVLPEAHASKWGGECWLRVRHADAAEIDRADRVAKAGGKSLKSAEKASLRMERGKPVLDIPTPGKGRRHEIREGSLKWDVVYEDASALPVDGIERFQLEFPDGMTWHYQPALTLEEIAEGHERPEEMVGGYVAYWAQSGRYLDGSGEEVANYETGRFGDIKAPLWVDASGKTLRWTQELVGSELRCFLPTEWLVTAVYPVRLDPEFGFTSIGASLATSGSVRGSEYSLSVSGDVSSITAYWTSQASQTGDINYAIYDGSNDLVAHVGSTDISTLSWLSYSHSAWYTVPFGSKVPLAAGNYLLVVFAGITTIGRRISYDSVSSKRYYLGSASTTPPDQFNGTIGTADFKYSIYATYEESGGGGSTLTTDSAWKIFTAADTATAWAIRAALSQSSAWAVFTRADAESAWSIRTSSDAETAWSVRAWLDTPTAWPISTAADTQTEWQIKAGLDAETAWPIFNAVDTATAWAILNSLALETPTSWSIRNALAAEAAWSIRTALDTGSAWSILSRMDRETAWQILGAGILDTPTSWAIRADLDQSTSWTIKTSLDAATDWTIINGMDAATAWDILQGFATDTAWQVYRGLDTATAWSIISDTVPEPVKVFMAEPRDFIINAEKRIFILLAERK